MLRLYYTKCLEELEIHDDRLFSPYRKERLKRIAASSHRKQSIAAELLLNYAAREFSSEIVLPLSIAPTDGKPEIYGGEFFFSISHSEDVVACAVSSTNVGLDVQFEKGYKQNLAKRFYTGSELEYIESSKDRENTFYKLWTLKESYVKAIGEGISYGLDSFSVNPDSMSIDGENAALWHSKVDDCHFALCILGASPCVPETLKYINIEELL